MDSTATAPRNVADSRQPTLVEAIAATGRRSRAAREARMPVLVRYWRSLALHDLATRLGWFEAVRAGLRSGSTTADAFAVFALGDADEQIVFDAVSVYVGAHPVSVEHRRAVIQEAVDWIRRGLVFNRGAAFAALLCCDDEDINQELKGVRQRLTHEDIESVSRCAGTRTLRRAPEFLAEWIGLLESAVEPDARALESLMRLLQRLAG